MGSACVSGGGFISEPLTQHPHLWCREHFFYGDVQNGPLTDFHCSYKIYVMPTSPENGLSSEAFPHRSAASLCDIGYHNGNQQSKEDRHRDTGKQNLYILFQRESLHECLSLALWRHDEHRCTFNRVN